MAASAKMAKAKALKKKKRHQRKYGRINGSEISARDRAWQRQSAAQMKAK
jgi:hypothetical protein